MRLDDASTLIGLAAPVFGALGVGIWRFASLATRVEYTLKRLEEKIADFDEFRTSVQQVPEHARRIGTLEGAVSAVMPRLAVVEKVISNRGFQAARDPYQSRPRIGEDEGEE